MQGHPTFRVREARPADLELLVRHRRQMWEAIYAREPRARSVMDEADRVYRRWSRPRMRNRTLLGFIAEDEAGRPLGSGCLWVMPSQPRPGWSKEATPYVLSMFTEEVARGRGVASAILSELLSWSRAAGFPRVVLHASEQGQGVYERLGFERTTEMRYMIGDPHPRRGRAARARGSRTTRARRATLPKRRRR